MYDFEGGRSSCCTVKGDIQQDISPIRIQFRKIQSILLNTFST